MKQSQLQLTLENDLVLLRPLTEQDFDALYDAAEKLVPSGRLRIPHSVSSASSTLRSTDSHSDCVPISSTSGTHALSRNHI